MRIDILPRENLNGQVILQPIERPCFPQISEESYDKVVGLSAGCNELEDSFLPITPFNFGYHNICGAS